MVVAGGIEDQLAQEFPGDGVDDADMQVVDQHKDVGSGVGSPDADVVRAAVVIGVGKAVVSLCKSASVAGWAG